MSFYVTGLLLKQFPFIVEDLTQFFPIFLIFQPFGMKYISIWEKCFGKNCIYRKRIQGYKIKYDYRLPLPSYFLNRNCFDSFTQ